MITRRGLLGSAGALLAAGALPRTAWGSGLPDTTRAALIESGLVYLTPLKSDGAESACHAEIWFAFDGNDLYLVTAADAWRARAIANGLDQARIWVGDFGNWKKAGDRFREAPELMASGTVVSDEAGIEHGLKLLGDKYSVEWVVWGPRFRGGLAEGSRVMLRYTPAV